MSNNYNWNFTPKSKGYSFAGIDLSPVNFNGWTWKPTKPLSLTCDLGNTQIFSVDLKIKNLTSGGITFRFTF
ncbi:hypothetical protein IJ750_06220 [bacterium]|nr:hypothetical protein [bacterium]MBR1776646.1 hypothetical protein [bacterium]